MAHERKCIVDGTEYKYCPHCSAYNQNEKWRLIYCSEKCMEIDSTCRKYQSGELTGVESKAIFKKLKLPKNLSSWISPIIDEIMSSKKVVNEIKEETE